MPSNSKMGHQAGIMIGTNMFLLKWSYVNMDSITPSSLLQCIRTINPFKALQLECNVQLPNEMPYHWWSKDTGKVDLGYEQQPIRAIISKAMEFFTGVRNDNLAMLLLFHSELKPKAERDALDSLYMQHLEETDTELSWLPTVIVQTEQQMRFLNVVTKSRDALWEGWVTSVQDQWYTN
ncbi:hypothetical protein V8B97DRAFT_1914462 [Scleroderma yunnanense]